jgi:hypothetical protein
LWVDFIEPFSLPLPLLWSMEEEPPLMLLWPLMLPLLEPLELPVWLMRELWPWVGVAVVAAGVGWPAEVELCAKAAPLITVQPATMARISFVLRMTSVS